MISLIQAQFFSTRRLSVLLLLPLLLTQFGCVSSVPLESPMGSPFSAGNSEAGEFVWRDLLTGEPELAKQFYGDLFGWDFESTGRITLIKVDQRAIGSIMEMPPTETRHATRWVASLGVVDIEKATQWTRLQGGKVHEGPRDMRDRGKVALVSDSLGAQIALVELGLEKSEQSLPAVMNDWLWDELWTRNTDKALEFYSGLYGFEPDEIAPGYWILKSGNHWRGGIRELFDPALEQRWVPVIRVVDVQEMSAQAEALGGRIVLAADQGEAGDKTALIADPGGALFMVQEWSGKESLEGSQE